MSYQDTFEHILAALYDAMLDDARWPAASALIDDACGITGNDLMVGEGSKDDVRALFIGSYYRGQRREDLEREYLEDLPSHRRTRAALSAAARQVVRRTSPTCTRPRI